MTTLSSDTPPEIERLQIEGLRQMPSWRKMALVAGMGQTVRMLALAGLRQRYPKVDVFIARPRDFDHAQLDRRQLYLLSEDPERHAYVASAEDTVLCKLERYRLGGEVSDRQWRDVVGVLNVQGDRFDQDYMRCMAASLGVADLLSRAFEEAG